MADDEILGQRASAALFDWNTRRLSIVSGTREVTRWTLWDNDDRQILPVSESLTLRRGLAGEAFFYGSPSGQITILNRDGTTRRHNFGTMSSIAFSEDGKRAAILRRALGEQFTLTVMEANSARTSSAKSDRSICMAGPASTRQSERRGWWRWRSARMHGSCWSRCRRQSSRS